GGAGSVKAMIGAPFSKKLANPRGGQWFFLMRQYAGVMEWWSNGVMRGLIQLYFLALAFSITPILQYSKIAASL
ncbi:MAG: hypothetical protein LJE89_08255, partial [Deltaproteobacteria bacterium]|nr:hypothetical protein [Deltaproteobacteria bacterium]